MANDPAFLVYYKDILVSCADWDADVLGWYFRLLSHQADKPGGLPPDLESLASLAGVKFSHFDRFALCWKHTLSAKFEANAEGLMINGKMDAILSDRRRYKEKQAHRGLVGAFVKKAKLEGRFTPHQLGIISKELFLVISPDNSKEDNEGAYKRTLIAFIGNANAIGNINGFKEGGMGEGGVIFDIEKYLLDRQGELEIALMIKPGTTLEKGKDVLKKFHLWMTSKEQYPKAPLALIAGFQTWLLNEKNYNNGTTHSAKSGTTAPRVENVTNGDSRNF